MSINLAVTSSYLIPRKNVVGTRSGLGAILRASILSCVLYIPLLYN